MIIKLKARLFLIKFHQFYDVMPALLADSEGTVMVEDAVDIYCILIVNLYEFYQIGEEQFIV